MPYLKTRDTTLHIRIAGKGIPIVLIPPPVLGGICFRKQVEALSKQYQTIALDLRGQGKSQPSNKPITYEVFADDIRDVLDELGIDKAVLVGYSTGGSIVLEFLLRHPERAIGGIVLGGMSEVRDLRVRGMISLGVMMTKLKWMRPLSFGLTLTNAKGKEWRRSTYQETRHGDPEDGQAYYRYSMQYNCTADLPKIQHPVWLIYGARDTSFRPYGKLLRERLPNSKFILLSKTGHRIPSEAPKTLNRLIKQFVEEHAKLHVRVREKVD